MYVYNFPGCGRGPQTKGGRAHELARMRGFVADARESAFSGDDARFALALMEAVRSAEKMLRGLPAPIVDSSRDAAARRDSPARIAAEPPDAADGATIDAEGNTRS